MSQISAAPATPDGVVNVSEVLDSIARLVARTPLTHTLFTPVKFVPLSRIEVPPVMRPVVTESEVMVDAAVTESADVTTTGAGVV